MGARSVLIQSFFCVTTSLASGTLNSGSDIDPQDILFDANVTSLQQQREILGCYPESEKGRGNYGAREKSKLPDGQINLHFGFDDDKPSYPAERVFSIAPRPQRAKGTEDLLVVHHRNMMKRYIADPAIGFIIEGGATQQGDEEYNFGLSRRRAENVAEAARLSGVNSKRLCVRWTGEEFNQSAVRISAYKLDLSSSSAAQMAQGPDVKEP